MDHSNIMTEEELDAIVNLAQTGANSKRFLSANQKKLVPLEHIQMTNLVQNFVLESQKKLSSFLRKKISVQFDSIHSCCISDLHDEEKQLVFSNFKMKNISDYGLIYFDLLFLHTVINLLYGGQVRADEPVMALLGKASVKIARQVFVTCVGIFEQSLIDLLSTELTLLKTSQQLNLLANPACQDVHFHLMFKVDFGEVQSDLNLVLSESAVRHIINDVEETEVEPAQTEQQANYFRDILKNELIDSTVTIRACLPDVCMKVKDVMNLKAGDKIPISDPTVGYITLNQKKLFKVSAGQHHEKRVLKVIDTA